MKTSVALDHERVGAMVSRLSTELDGVEAVVKVVLDELGSDPERLRAALTEILPDFVATQIRDGRAGRARGAGRLVGNGKRQAIMVWHSRFLADQLHTAGGWRRMGDCTFDDLMFAVTERRVVAARTLAAAAEYERLANALKAHNAATVADLPALVVRAALTGDAA